VALPGRSPAPRAPTERACVASLFPVDEDTAV
jgi:hypothetical protein